MYKLLLVFLFFVGSLFADKMSDLKNDTSIKEFLDYYSTKCYGSNSEVDNKIYKVQYQGEGAYCTSSQKGHDFEDTIYFDGIPCQTKKYNSNLTNDDIGSEFIIYYSADDDPYCDTIELRSTLVEVVDTTPPCEVLSAPSQMVVDGRDYQGIVDGDSACAGFHTDNGDGTGYTFVNPHSDPTNCTTGYCYFNVYNPCDNIPTPPSVTVVDGKDFQAVSSDTGCVTLADSNSDGMGYSFVNYSEGDTYCDGGYCYYNLPESEPIDDGGGDTIIDDPDNPDDSGDTTGGDTVVDLAELIPYVDDLEAKNDQIIANTAQTNTELSTLNSNLNTLNSTGSQVNNNLDSLNTGVNSVNTGLDSLNSGISDLKSGIDQLNNRNANLDSSLNGITAPEPYDMSGDLTDFTNTYQTTLDDTFSSYGNVFGLGGYGSAPSPISFDLLGNTYTVFDVSWIGANNTEMIRNIFLVTAYLFGIFVVFRGI